MNPLRSVGARLGLALAVVVAAALVLVDLIVVPSLERNLIDAKLTQLSEAARIGIYLTDMSLFPDLNEVYAGFFAEPFPVRTTVGVAALPKGALVEMDATVPLARAT